MALPKAAIQLLEKDRAICVIANLDGQDALLAQVDLPEGAGVSTRDACIAAAAQLAVAVLGQRLSLSPRGVGDASRIGGPA